MGTGTSRGKKVAPVCVSELNVTKTGSAIASPKQDDPTQFRSLEAPTAVSSVRKSARPDGSSVGHGAHSAGEDNCADRELETVLADYEECESVSVKKTYKKRSFVKSKKYGLCHFRQDDTESDVSSAPPQRTSGGAEEPRVSPAVPKDVNKRSNLAFTHSREHNNTTKACPNQQKGCLTRGTSLEAIPTSEKQPSRDSLTMPVMLYHGSEEELMDTIEKEFS
ncbi:unnamed protein product [Menidia menidia]|uniref:(Atlantic silverside) hypothetical protein n=1 Tax=Menidia menidia TaxID=238744 RepID=A0A8S4AK01_9TELE|nr:unnamed protein product [Menidia menidia]